MWKVKRFWEFLKVVINNFQPIANELIKSVISKNKLRLRSFGCLRRLRIGFALGILAILFYWPMFLANNSLDQNLAGSGVFKKIANPPSSSEILKKLEIFREEELVCEPNILFVENFKTKIPGPPSSLTSVKMRDFGGQSWKKIFDLKKADFNVEAIKSELSQMRYHCNSNWNRRVDVLCLGRNSYCMVEFEVLILEQKFKVIFRSEISANGFDEVSNLKIFVWSKDDIKVDLNHLVLKIVKLRPKCTPFKTD